MLSPSLAALPQSPIQKTRVRQDGELTHEGELVRLGESGQIKCCESITRALGQPARLDAPHALAGSRLTAWGEPSFPGCETVSVWVRSNLTITMPMVPRRVG